MAMLRSLGSTSFTRLPAMRISPSVVVSSPAIMRSTVDLPQPDGPTITTNSPSSIFTSVRWMTSVLPKLLVTPCRLISAICFRSVRFDVRRR